MKSGKELIKIIKDYNKMRPTVIWHDFAMDAWFSWKSGSFPIVTDEELSVMKFSNNSYRRTYNYLIFDLGFNI